MLPYTATDMLYAIKFKYGLDRETRLSNAASREEAKTATARPRRGRRAWMHAVFTFSF